MRPFLSLPWKILILTISALLVMSVTLTSFAWLKMEQDFKIQQEKQLLLRQQQFEHLNQLLENQLRSWLESFSDMADIRNQPDFQSFAGALAKHFDTISLHLNVENLWLFDRNSNLLHASSPAIPARIRQSVSQVITELQPYSEIVCQDQCVKVVMLPVQDQRGDVAVVAMTTTLLDMLSSLKQGVGSEVAIVRIDGDLQGAARDLRLMSLSNANSMAAVFAAISPDATVSQAIEQGLSITVDAEQYLISFLPLVNSGHGYYLALVDDVSGFARTKQKYQQQMVLFALSSFLIIAAVIYFSTLRLSNRLLTMARHLPLLAQRQFAEFRQKAKTEPLLLSDELDVLSKSAEQLSVELEQLHATIEQNTRELENIAMYDLLTGLPNRNMLQFNLKKALQALQTSPGQVAVLFLDLDDFKKINDTQGHAAGDQLLMEAAARIRRSIRPIDLACRFGGDEFVVVISEVHPVDIAVKLAEQILAEFQQPIELNQQLFYVSASIGMSIASSADTQADDLIRQADIAMYDAKERGRGLFTGYDQTMFLRLANRIKLESELKEALQLHQFDLVFQPQIELATGRLSGFEALLRWHHPLRGVVAPDEFIGVLENSSQMVEVGYWMFRRCFELVAQLVRRGYRHIKLSINLSAGQFLDPNLPVVLAGLVDEFSLPGNHFELELTERTLVKNIDQTLVMMRQLKALGFYFSIDDFGTGYSSLSYLKQMPVDVIKIDKSFVFGMLENDADYQIIVSTIAMVQKLELQVVAEGVENRAQLQVLRQHKCDLGQGYYFARPLNEQQLDEFLQNKAVDGFLQLA